MPLYEYEIVDGGETNELLRSMAAADDPVVDPSGRGRTFRRKLSTFMVAEPARGGAEASSSRPFPSGGGCGCGAGGCGH